MRLGWGSVLLVGCGFAVSTSDLGDLSLGDLGECKVRTGEPCLADGDCNSGHCANGVCS